MRCAWTYCTSRLTVLAMMAIAANPISRAGDIYMRAPLISSDVSRFVNRQETGHATLSLQQVHVGRLAWESPIRVARSDRGGFNHGTFYAGGGPAASRWGNYFHPRDRSRQWRALPSCYLPRQRCG
jgi:hypothetical protein